MKEVKNTTIYTNEIVKKFLEIYYFEKIKTLRIILNVLIIIMIVSFFTNSEKTTLDIITLILSLFGILEINTTMIPRLNYYKLTKKKDSILGSKVTYIFRKTNFNLNRKENIEYITLNKVIETEKNYYLYLNSSKSLIVDKTKLKEDEINFITENLKEKVSTYKYKNNV